MQMKITTLFGKGRVLLAAVVALALGAPIASAETIFEDFENLTVVDADGNALANSWTAGYGLSNGWKVIGGSIQSGENSYANFALTKDTGKGWLDSDYYLCSTASSTNSAYMFIPKQLQGDITFYVKSSLSSRSSGTSSVKVYEADAEGNVDTSALLYEATPVKGGNWLPCTISEVTGKYIAINLVRCLFDDFTAEVGDGSSVVVTEKKSITVTAFALTTDCSYANPIVANEENQFSADFNVTVKNNGNVNLAGEDVKVQVETADGVVCGTATATEILAVDGEVVVPVTITADAGDLGTSKSKMFTFYAREQLGNIRFSTGRYVYVTPYQAKFAISGPDGYTLAADETVSFGTSKEAVTRTITIKNDGTAPLAVSGIALPDGFTASETDFDVEAGVSKTVTLTMVPAAPYGVKGGTVTISHALGEFTFAVSGATVDPAKFFVNFEDQQFPASWTVGEKWAITSQSGNYYAYQSSNAEATALITQRLTVAEGEAMTFEAKRAYAYNAATLTVAYSTDQENWTTAGSYDLTSAFETYVASGIPAGDWYLKFEGQYVAIDNIAGFTESTDAPVLGVYVGETALNSGELLDFALVNEDTSLLLIVKNDGTGTLNATIVVTGEGFSVSKESISLEAGETTDVIVTMAAQPWGIKTGTLTIGDMTFDLEGESRDPEILFVDFEDGQWPAGWLAGKNWTVYQQMAEQYDYTEEASELVTAKLLVEEGMSLQFDAKRSSETYTSSLTVLYSNDKKNWITTEATIELTTEMITYSVALPEGEWYVMFSGCNVNLDNITGVKLSQAVDHIVSWTCDVPAEGMVNNEYQATAVVTNEGMDGEEVTVRFYLEGELVMEETITMSLGQTNTFTYVFTPLEANEGMDAYFEVQYADLPVEKSDPVTIVIKAEEGESVTLQGTVTDQDNETPLGGAVVTLTCEDIIYSAITDDDGKYAMTVYKFGPSYKYTVSIEMEGYESYMIDTYYVNSFGEDTVEENFQLKKETTTAINDICNLQNDGSAVYNLAGQKVASNRQSTKGLYIVNGKKYVK